jgi:hypothetical protein
LDSLGLSSCSFIKIDVEGHEIEVIEGAHDTIRALRPRILAEVREKNATLFESILSNLGYVRADIRNFIGCPGGDGNRFYIPG